MKVPSDSASLARAESVAQKILGTAESLCRGGHYFQAFEMLDEVADRPDFDLSAQWGPRYQSFYGLCVAMVFGQISRGERLCREALEAGGFEADLAYNLGLIYLRCRRRDLAFLEFRDVLRVSPSHQPTRLTMKRLGVRRRPVFPFLDRSHPLNKLTGKLVYRVKRAWQDRTAQAAA